MRTPLAIVALLAGVLTPFAYGQRGMGDPTGVARQIPKPELVTFSGEIVAVETKPCEKRIKKDKGVRSIYWIT
jgi:hypothetical protein